jgi:Uma2 family endonuclease
MSNAIRILPHYTYEDYCQWEGRWELIDGIPYAMSPAPTPKHQWISSNIISEFRVEIKKKKCKNCKVYNFIDFKIKEDVILQPDVLIVCQPIEKKFLDFPPALVVEILSPSTAIKDRNTKFSYYQQQQVKYYIIVDIDKEIIEIYLLNKNGEYQLETAGAENSYSFELENECATEIDLSNIWQ